MTVLLSSRRYGFLTRLPGEVGVVLPEQRPLPVLVEPAVQPLVTSPRPEPLVPVEHPSVRVLSSYWHAGWVEASPGALLRAGAFKRLVAAVESLPAPFGLAVFDSHRPLSLQREIYAAAYADPSLPPGFVSVPSDDPFTPPPHLTGGTVDVTLTWEGHALALGTEFDDFTPAAAADSLEAVPGLERSLRRLLYWTMRSQGFVVIGCEWWHFEYGTRRWAALTGNEPVYGPASLLPSQR